MLNRHLNTVSWHEIIIRDIIGTFSNIYENRWIVCSSRAKSSSDVTAWQFSQRCLIHHHQEQQCFHLEIKFSRSSLRSIAVMLKQAISKKEHKHKRYFISKASLPDWLYLISVCGVRSLSSVSTLTGLILKWLKVVTSPRTDSTFI